MTDHRMLLVHAHPDDECINNGATMARYVDEGAAVTLVTCTAGEMGEVLVPDLAYLAYDEKGGLGEHRRGELDEAMKVLGVTDHRFLGGFGRFHDSGMAWHEEGHAIPAETIPDNAFWHADLNEAADELGDSARFIGLNIRDSSREDAQAFVRSLDVTYPSVHSADGAALLPFAGTLTPRSIPSTVVLDAQGRIAASVQGRLPSALTLVDLVEEAAR